MKTVYIAGPMRGIPEYNFPAFDAARDAWKAKGWNVISPADLDRVLDKFDPKSKRPVQHPFAHYMKRDIDFILGYCDAIAFLPGWDKSVGAKVEAIVGQALDLDFYDAITFELEAKPIVDVKVVKA